MLTRIRGLLILLRLFAPLILASIIVVASWAAANQIGDATSEYSAAMGARVDAIEVDLSAAAEGLETIGAFVGKTRDAVAAQAAALSALTDRIDIHMPTIPLINFDIPDINFTVPGVTQLKELGADLAAAGREVGAEIAAVARLGAIPTELQAIASDSTEFAGSIWDAVFGWLRILVIATVVGLIVWLLGRLGSFLSEFQMGWRMLRHGLESDVAPDMRRLAARVRKLERAVAGI